MMMGICLTSSVISSFGPKPIIFFFTKNIYYVCDVDHCSPSFLRRTILQILIQHFHIISHNFQRVNIKRTFTLCLNSIGFCSPCSSNVIKTVSGQIRLIPRPNGGFICDSVPRWISLLLLTSVSCDYFSVPIHV